MAAFIKTKLVALKVALGVKDWPLVEKLASDVLGYESANYNARVFRSLALFHLERFDESEESYKKAVAQAPTQALAHQGLASFYEKRQRWSDYAWTLLELMQLFERWGDAVKLAETWQKLVVVRRTHGTRLELIDALSYLLPSSSLRGLLATLPTPNSTNPTASTVHETQLLLLSTLPLLLEILSLICAEESMTIEAEVKKRRQRLGGQTMSALETRRAVEGELLPTSRAVALYEAILADPDAAENVELRREMEHRLLVHLRTHLAALPSSMDPPSLNLNAVPQSAERREAEEREKARFRSQVEQLSRGLVIIRAEEEGAWNVVFDWSDVYTDFDALDWREIESYWTLFPQSGLAQIAKASYELRARAAFVETDDEPTPPPAPTTDEVVSIVQKGLEASPDSLLAHLLGVHFFSGGSEWDAVVQVAQEGLGVLERTQTEMGRPLPKSNRTLESHLAIALVHYESPTNHLRALRLLDSLIFTAATPVPALSIAKAYVQQAAQKWSDAVVVWDAVLAMELDPERALEVKGERSWCLYEDGELRAAEEGLQEVVEELEKLKMERDEAGQENQKRRSKAGIELREGDQEGESTLQAEQRAQAWWRLGKCFWDLGLEDTEYNEHAYHAFIASLRASSHYAPSFTSLGMYFLALAPPDPAQASKYFQKAFELSSGEEVAARYLAEEFSESGDWTLVEVIARRVVDGKRGAAVGGKGAERLSWAWKAIGGAELNSGKYPQAIAAFQSALRGAPQDVHTWVRLGVAYRASGKHIAALKVFAKALAIDPDEWYTRFSIGDVQRELGLLDAAIKTFREILAKRPDELGVKVVLAETLLSYGIELVGEGFASSAERSFVDALSVTEGIISRGEATRVAWKVAGDALGGLGAIVEPRLSVEATGIALRLWEKLAEEGIDAKIEGMDVITTALLEGTFEGEGAPELFLALSVLAFKMRVLLETTLDLTVGSAWLDFGLSIARLRPVATALGLSLSTEEILQQAIQALKFALRQEPRNSLFWNALGVLAFDLSPRLAQHSFIKALEHDARSAVPWTNLGFFYLFHQDGDLANQAFLKAQVLDPDWTAAWVGQALLAEQEGSKEQAEMLFEHAFSLASSLPEADLGFATSAFAKYRQTRKASRYSTTSADDDAVKVNAAEKLSKPIFALSRYLSLRPNDYTALHLHALLLEQIGDLGGASTSLEQSARLLEQLYEVDESPRVEAQFVIAQTNLGRVRLVGEDYGGALAAFETSLSLLNIDAAVPSLPGSLSHAQSVLLFTECRLGSGLAQYFLGQRERAIETFETGLEDIYAATVTGTEKNRRADLDVALGKVHMANGDEDLAISSFMDSPNALTSSTPLPVKLAMYAVAIISRDRGILDVRRREEGRFAPGSRGGDKYHPAIIQMQVWEKLVEGDLKEAVLCLSRAVHAAPWDRKMRLDLIKLLLQTSVPRTSTDVPDGEDDNVAIAKRLLDSIGDDSTASVDERCAFLRASALVHLVARASSAPDGTEGQDTATTDEAEGIRLLEKAIFLKPWDLELRKSLEEVRSLLRI